MATDPPTTFVAADGRCIVLQLVSAINKTQTRFVIATPSRIKKEDGPFLLERTAFTPVT